MKPDNELLRQYASTRSEDAFAELVRRHLNLVYSAALRQVSGDAHLARDAAQNVFTDLARKSASLSHRESLTGWLYTSAYFAANKIVRAETRRRQREEQFMREPATHAASDADWEQLRPALDAVMHELNETDREAVLLRYFENRAFAEVGAKLNLNENAARMRVDRALEKLRALLAKRGITTGAALASVISANAIQTAPDTLAAGLAGTSLAGASPSGLTIFGMNATKFKICVGVLAVTGAAIVFITTRNTHASPRIQNTPAAVESIKAGENFSSNVPAPVREPAASSGLARPVKVSAEAGRLDAAKNSPMPGPPPATNTPPNTNKAIINLKIRFVSLTAENVQALRPAWPGGDSGILTADQFNFVNRTLKHTGNFSMAQSQIVAFNGQQAAISVKSPVHVEEADTNVSIDTLFGVTPYYSADTSVFRLELFLSLRGPREDSSPDEQAVGKTNELTLSTGQVAVLQKEIPSALLPLSNSTDAEQELLVFVTPELGKPNSDDQASETNHQPGEVPERRLDEAKQGMLAMLMFASDHQDAFPTNLTQASGYLKDGAGEEIQTNFDMVYSGPIAGITNPMTTIVLKAKQAWQTPDGKWMKVYGFADGHSEIRTELNDNFEAFEKEHIIAPAN